MYPPRPLFGSPVPLSVVSVKSSIVGVTVSSVALGSGVGVVPGITVLVISSVVLVVLVAWQDTTTKSKKQEQIYKELKFRN